MSIPSDPAGDGTRSRKLHMAVAGAAILVVSGVMVWAAMALLRDEESANAAQDANAGAPWSANCSSAGRGYPVGCFMEQRVVLRPTGQLLTAVRLTFPPNAQQPTLMIQTPFGLAIRQGISLQIDKGTPVKFDVETCDQGGCYAASLMPESLMSELAGAKTLSVHFVALDKRPVDVPVSMNGFADALRAVR